MGYVQKKSKTIKKKMNGLKSGRPADLKRMSYRFRTVSRPYGGILTHQEVKLRIMRAFMTEELLNIKQKQRAAEKKTKKVKKVKAAVKKGASWVFRSSGAFRTLMASSIGVFSGR